jgi:hypothetical protein
VPFPSPSQIGEDRNDFGTEFGPANVALHAVAVALELGDAGHALDLGREIDAERLSAERQAGYSIDLALAHSMCRQVGEALRYLKLAEELTPEQTGTHRVARVLFLAQGPQWSPGSSTAACTTSPEPEKQWRDGQTVGHHRSCAC